jgi:Fe-S cluster assembly protein SufB
MARTRFFTVTSVESIPKTAIGIIVNGYAKEVLNKLPMEFAVEAQKLLQISLEGSVG